MTEIQEAKALLLKFTAEMKDWENKFQRLYKSEAGGPELYGAIAKLELGAIYDKYLTDRDRTQGRMAGPSVGFPPEFDPDAEVVEAAESPTKNKVVVETLWTHPNVPSSKRKQRYTLVFKNSEWRLDRKEIFSTVNGAWAKRVL